MANGITIRGCEFKNLTPSTNPQDNGIGIFSINAGFNLIPYCTSNDTLCPEENLVKNTFNNLNYGVWAGLSTLPINIDQCEFENNYCGILAFHAQNVNITNNDINVGTIGLLLNRSNAYKVQENTFSSDKNIINYGIVVMESGPHPNLIYKNTFENKLSIPCHSEGENCGPWNTAPVDVPESLYLGAGLVFKCNDYAGEKQLCDIEITSGGIAANQGFCYDVNTPAGNIFNTGPTLPQGNIAIGSHVSSPFTYYYHDAADAIPDIYSSSNIDITTHNCDISTSSCPGYFSGSNPSGLISTINNYSTLLISKVAPIIYGNTQSLLNKVINANTTTGLTFAQLTNELIAVSPYVSDTVLIASINKYDTLEPEMLKEVMTANSPLTNKVRAVLDTKALPDSIIQAIGSVQSGISARADLEAQITDTMMWIGFAENELVRQYINDTSISGLDSVISYFTTRMDDLSRKALVEAYFTKNDSTNMISALDSLTLYNYSDTLYKDFYTLMSDYCTNKKLLTEMDSVEEQIIRGIAASNTEASAPAQAVLALVFNEIPGIELEKLDIPDSMSIHGYLYCDSLCNNGLPAAGDSIIVLDADTGKVSFVSVVTDSNGYFVFYLPELLKLSDTALYGFGATDGTPVKDFELKTIDQWIAASPINLTLQKTEADFTFDSIHCFGDSIHFNAVITGGMKPYTYLWNFGNDSTSTSSNPAMYYSQADTFNVTLIVASADGCVDTISKIVIVNPLPTASIVPTSLTICAGDSANFTASGGQAYLWNTSDTTSTIIVTSLINSTYTVTVTNSFGCIDTAIRIVNVNPSPWVIIYSTAYSVCTGDSVTFTASSDSVSYLWNTADTTAVITFKPDSTATYTVTVTDASGCTNTANGTITVYSLPAITITPSSITLCPGDSTTLTASGGATYLWSTSDSTDVISVSPDSTTTYTVTVTSSAGCSAMDTVVVAVGTFTITGRTMYAGKANTGTSPHPPTYNSRTYDINKVIAILKNQSGTEIARDTSDVNGAFTFSDICNGTYTLYYDKYTADTMQWVNNVNSIDCSIILAYIGTDTTSDSSKNFSRIYKKAADVNNSGSINTNDRSLILAKIGSPNNASYNFSKGNWVNLDTTITVNNSNLNFTVPVISYGDFNASSSKYLDSTNTWSQVKALPDKNIIYISDENMVINGSGILEIPLRIYSPVDDFAALGLELYYPVADFKLVSASMPNTADSNGVFKINPTLQEIIDHNDDLLVTDDSGTIRVVFATTKYFNIASNDVVVNLGFQPIHELTPGEVDFKLSGTGVIGDQNGEIESKDYNFLIMPKIYVQGNNNNAEFEFSGYPNPFTGNATLTYNLPEDGMVKLIVYNAIGEQVAELVNEMQVCGKHSAVFSPDKLPQGIYTFRLDYTGSQNSNCAVLKMMH